MSIPPSDRRRRELAGLLVEFGTQILFRRMLK
jgi:hypothetical protein